MIKLSNELIRAVTASVTNNSSVERSDKELFLLAYKEYKSVSKGSRGHITNLLNIHVGTVTKSINIQNTLKRVFKVAFNYVDMTIISSFKDLEYTNINSLVKLFKWVDNNLEDKEAKELRQTIKEVYDSELSTQYYNNDIAKKIIELKEQYKLQDTEGEFKVVEFFNTIKAGIKNLTDEQVAELLTLVIDEYNKIQEEA